MSEREATLGQVMQMLGAKSLGTMNEGTRLNGTCAIDSYQPGRVGFVRIEKYAGFLAELTGAVVLIPEAMQELAARYPQNNYLVVGDVSVALFELQDFFYRGRNVPAATGIAPTSVVASSARMGADVHVGDYACISHGASIGDRTKILSHAYVGDGVAVGPDTVVYPNVVVYPNSRIGAGCIIHAGAVVGAEGFRFEHDYQNKRVRKLIHVGGVSIGDRVEIGANTTIDRATFENDVTVLEDDVKLDDQVHIGHNARIGARSFLAAQTCISGSVVIGEDVWIGAGVTVSNGVTVGDRAVLLINTVVASDVPQGERMSGFYAMPHTEWRRVYAYLRGLTRGAKGRSSGG